MKNKLLFQLRFVCTGVILVCSTLSQTAFATSFTVIVTDFSFSPDTLSCSVGDTVFFSWSAGTHTTTSVSVPAGAAAWDEPIESTNTSYAYPVTVAGTYNYKCTPHAAMNMVGSFTASPISGIEAIKSGDGLASYPNPVRSSFMVTYEVTTGGPVDVELLDLLGRKTASFFSGFRSAGIHSSEFEINPGLSNGLYYVSIRSGMSSRLRKIIIQK